MPLARGRNGVAVHRSASAPDLVGGPDRYEVIDTLAYGVVADVLLALRTDVLGPSSLVVLKRMRACDADDAQVAEMFLKEAQISMKLRHPNVVQGLALGDDDGRPFLVLEHIEGETLMSVQKELARRGERLPPALAAHVAAEMARGLHYAHELEDVDGTPLGIIHRDVSPNNVILGYDGSVKLIDFGVAKTTLPGEPTTQGALKGKLAYMAPEQVLGRAIDGRADLFALGICLWEMLTGETLMQGASMFETMDRVLRVPTPRVTSLVPDILPELDGIVARALAREPARRYETVEIFRLALRGYLKREAPGSGADDVARLMDRIFSEKRAQQTAIRRAMVAARRGYASGAAPAAYQGSVSTPAPAEHREAPATTSSHTGVRRLDPPEERASGEREMDPWSAVTSRRSNPLLDVPIGDRVTVPMAVPVAVLRASMARANGTLPMPMPVDALDEARRSTVLDARPGAAPREDVPDAPAAGDGRPTAAEPAVRRRPAALPSPRALPPPSEASVVFVGDRMASADGVPAARLRRRRAPLARRLILSTALALLVAGVAADPRGRGLVLTALRDARAHVSAVLAR